MIDQRGSDHQCASRSSLRTEDGFRQIRVPYAAARLIVHGPLAELTKKLGTTGQPDGGTGTLVRTGGSSGGSCSGNCSG